MIILDWFYQLIEILVAFIKDMGYIGIFIGMTIESSFFHFPAKLL